MRLRPSRSGTTTRFSSHHCSWRAVTPVSCRTSLVLKRSVSMGVRVTSKHFYNEMFDAILLPAGSAVNHSLVPDRDLSCSPGNYGAGNRLPHPMGDLDDLVVSKIGVHGQ